MSDYNSLYKRFLSFFGFVACTFLLGCADEADSIKDQILSARPKNDGEVIQFNVQQSSKRKILRMCVQNNKYLTREALEKIVGIEINNFSENDDFHFNLWVVPEEGEPIKIEFEKSRDVNYVDGTPKASSCTSATTIWLSKSELSFNKFN